MGTNINMIRIGAKIKEMFDGYIDMSDLAQPDDNHLKSRALAALPLMMKCGLDIATSSCHVTDGYHDMGIDCIYLDESQKKLFLIQSKWREQGQGSISQEEMHSFVEGIRRITELDLEGSNNKIQVKKTDIDLGLTSIEYQIHAVFIHTGNRAVDDYAFRPMKALLNTTNDEVSTILVFEEIQYSEIYSFLAKGLESEDIVLDDVIIYNWGKVDEPYSAYYGRISAAMVGKWYADYGNRLFAQNIRYYKGNTDVNDGIRRALLQEPENFFYYNNGIKLLCKQIQRKAKESTTNATGLFTLVGVSLVNGAQTAGSIGMAFSDNPEQVGNAYVMIQIIDLSEANEGAATQITKLSNTQNRIENRDFAAMDPTQERIRQELSFSNYTYLYKSGDSITDSASQLTFDEAIIGLACLYEDVSYTTLTKRNVGALSDDITKAPYIVLMNPSTNSFAILNSVMIVRNVERELQRKKNELSGRNRLIVVHGNRFLAHRVLQQLKSENNFCKGIIDGSWIQQQTVSIIERDLPKMIDIINSQYADSYPANIFKNVKKCKEIKERMLSESI